MYPANRAASESEIYYCAVRECQKQNFIINMCIHNEPVNRDPDNVIIFTDSHSFSGC